MDEQITKEKLRQVAINRIEFESSKKGIPTLCLIGYVSGLRSIFCDFTGKRLISKKVDEILREHGIEEGQK